MVTRDVRLVVAGARATRNTGTDVRVRLVASWLEVSSAFLLLI
jgi:hypothetical protein